MLLERPKRQRRICIRRLAIVIRSLHIMHGIPVDRLNEKKTQNSPRRQSVLKGMDNRSSTIHRGAMLFVSGMTRSQSVWPMLWCVVLRCGRQLLAGPIAIFTKVILLLIRAIRPSGTSSVAFWCIPLKQNSNFISLHKTCKKSYVAPTITDHPGRRVAAGKADITLMGNGSFYQILGYRYHPGQKHRT